MFPLLQEIRDGASPEAYDLYGALVDHLPLLAEMEETPQDPEWHAEGNVWTHTSMVLNRCYEEWDGHGDRLVHVLGSFLHDIGKTTTTKVRVQEGIERVVSPQHAKVGRSYLMTRLRRLGLDQVTVDSIVSLVGYHHHPKPSMSGQYPKTEKLYQQQRVCDCRNLYRMERADIRGRIGPEEELSLLTLDLFKMETMEMGLWDNPDPYRGWVELFTDTFRDEGPEFIEAALYRAIYDYERHKFATPEEGVARSYQMREGFPTLILLSGPPGSGKSTWRKDYEHVVSLDEIRTDLRARKRKKPDPGHVMQVAWEQLRENLRRKHTVVWDATNITEKSRQKPIRLAKDYGAFVQVVAFDLDPDESKARNQQRTKPVPDKVFSDFIRRWQFPTETETHQLRVIGPEGERTPGSVI